MWQWDDESNGWKDYDAQMQHTLNELKKSPVGMYGIDVRIHGNTYHIDLVAMQQRKTTTRYVRKIRYFEPPLSVVKPPTGVPAGQLPKAGVWSIAKKGPQFNQLACDVFGVPLPQPLVSAHAIRASIIAHNSVDVSVRGGESDGIVTGVGGLNQVMYTEVVNGDEKHFRTEGGGANKIHSMRATTFEEGAAPARTKIRQLNPESQHFKRVVKRFQKKWHGSKYSSKTPEVIGVAEISMNKKAHGRYDSYAARVQTKMPATLVRTESMVEMGVKPGPGNTVYKFHATPCECDLMFRREAKEEELTLCNKPTCGMCRCGDGDRHDTNTTLLTQYLHDTAYTILTRHCLHNTYTTLTRHCAHNTYTVHRIMEGDFDVGRSGKAAGSLLGPGIYFTSNPHKADGYGNTGEGEQTVVA
jgi:hypothetical protein